MVKATLWSTSEVASWLVRRARARSFWSMRQQIGQGVIEGRVAERETGFA